MKKILGVDERIKKAMSQVQEARMWLERAKDRPGPPGPPPKGREHLVWQQDPPAWVLPPDKKKPQGKKGGKPTVESIKDDSVPAPTIRGGEGTEAGAERIRGGVIWEGLRLGPELSKYEWIEPIERADAKGKVGLYTIGGMKVPPGWRNSKINADPNGKYQAIGIDKKGDTKKIERPEQKEVRSQTVFEAAREFAKNWDPITKRIFADMETSEEAAVLAVISQTGLRVGNIASENFGVSTLEGRHVKIDGARVDFDFMGKSGKRNRAAFENRALANLLARKKQEKGESGKLFDTRDNRIRKYMTRIGFGQFSPKDFRTFHGTEFARHAVSQIRTPRSEKELKSAKRKVATYVSNWLNNTPQQALGSYIDPAVFQEWEQDLGLYKAMPEQRWMERWDPDFDLLWEDWGPWMEGEGYTMASDEWAD